MEMLSQSMRPNKLQEVQCQKAVVEKVNTWFIKNKVPNIIFLNGDSGTGKSTVAYIIALLLQCENVKVVDGISTPCLECSHCKDILTRSFQLDTTFIKGGEANKNDLLDISSSIKTTSILSNKSVFIIDESQSLGNKNTKGALLNLLENDLDDVYIIIISMEDISNDSTMKKALDSRVQKLKFKKPNSKEVSDYLFSLLDVVDPEEKIDISTFGEVILTIAEYSDGSMRQAIQDFDTVITQSAFDIEKMQSVLDYCSIPTVTKLFEMIINNDTSFFSDFDKNNISTIAFIKYGKKMFTDILIKNVSNNIDEYQYKTYPVFYKNIIKVKALCDILMDVNEYNLDEYKFKYRLLNLFSEKKEEKLVRRIIK